MVQDDLSAEMRLEKICAGFNSLTEEQQDYILGIMQALAFANNTDKNIESENDEIITEH